MVSRMRKRGLTSEPADTLSQQTGVIPLISDPDPDSDSDSDSDADCTAY